MKDNDFAGTRLAILAVLCAGFWLSPASSAQTGYYLTLASRVCDDYTDIMANRARNNIQESLRDLGADSVYESGEPVSPAIEDANNNCRPMATPWLFTLGGRIGGQDEGDYGRLSYVGDVNGSATTVAQVAELDTDGNATGSTIDWAVTLELTPQQLDLASRNALWVQGGSPGDPVNGQESSFGFGALRCAIDGLNGDNVESNKFPTGSKHVFCYAYYVNPPPTSGTIRVIKQQGGGDPASQGFEFRGNISYQENASGDNYFNLDVQNGAQSEIVFYRAETRPGDLPWTIWEQVPPGWNLASASCTSQSGGSVITPSGGLGSGGQEIELAAGDVVTCTYVNDVQLPVAGLLVAKTSTDDDPDNSITAVGDFDFLVAGTGVSETLQITTTQENLPAVDRLLSGLPTAQQYTISETAFPASTAGDWRLDAVNCLGEQPDSVDLGGASATLTLNSPAVCNFRNVLDFPGTLVIRKLTTNGVGRFNFDVGRPTDASFSLQGGVVSSRVNTPSAPLGFAQIPYGAVTITESSASTDDWELVEVSCNGRTVPHVNGTVVVLLTRAEPSLECLFTNTRVQMPGGGGSAIAVPVLGPWALLALGALIGGIGGLAARKRAAP